MTNSSTPTLFGTSGRFARRPRDGRTWQLMSIGAALLAILGSIMGLVGADDVYADVTDAFLPQALAQDITNIAVAAPVLAISAGLSMRGSVTASIIWLGATAFTFYSYVIYAFSVPFGPLFALWTTVLSLSLFALIGGLMAVDSAAAKVLLTNRRAVAVTAWVLLGVAGLFGLLWLGEDIQALLSGSSPQSAVDMNLPTNPVHVLDYGFFLPAAIASGVLLLKGQPFAHVSAPGFLVFMVLTCLPILITPIVQTSLALPVTWTALLPVGGIALVMTITLLWLLLSTSSRTRNRASLPRGL